MSAGDDTHAIDVAFDDALALADAVADAVAGPAHNRGLRKRLRPQRPRMPRFRHSPSERKGVRLSPLARPDILAGL